MTGVAPFPFQTFDTINNETIAKRWIFKGIMARGETSAWIGPPGSLKSALLAEATIFGANGADWRGKRCPNAVGVVYFAPERADLVKRRLFAHRQRLGLHDLPIAVVSSSINLMTPATVPRLIATIREAEERMQQQVRLRLMISGSGNLSSALASQRSSVRSVTPNRALNAPFRLVGGSAGIETRYVDTFDLARRPLRALEMAQERGLVPESVPADVAGAVA
jgi:hypothetical protein